MRLRPHHLLDIITQYGAGTPFVPHEYGHAVHTVAAAVKADPDVQIEFIVGADDICAPCKHNIGGRCDDITLSLPPSGSKQEYNDALDRRLMAFLGMAEGDVMTCRQYLGIIRQHLDGIERVCSSPREDPQARRANIEKGLGVFGC